MKDSLELTKVVLLGRTFEEYERYFGLDANDMRGRKVLDIASGVSSFCAEANQQGIEVTACDPIYELSPDEIQRRSEPDLDFVTQEIGKVKAYRWTFYKTPEGMRAFRERALRTFLADYRQRGSARYIAGKLPHLPFEAGRFDVVLVSYFLFVYEEQFDYAFHKAALLEVLRVCSGETRIYPLVNFRAERSSLLDAVKSDADFAAFVFEEVKTDFEFLANSNTFLRIRRK